MSVIHVTDTNFQTEVLESPIPVLVDFFGDFCGPCRALAPILGQLTAEVEGRAKIVKVDVTAEEKLSRQFRIEVIPTLIIFRNGEPTARMIGTKTKQELLTALNL